MLLSTGIQEILSPILQNKGTSGRKDRKDEKVFDLYDPYVMHFKAWFSLES